MPLDFSKKATKKAGGKFGDRDWTFADSKWVELTSKTSGWVGAYFQTQLTGPDGSSEEKNWMLMSAEELRDTYGIIINDDGQLEVVDEDLAKDFAPKSNQDTARLFNSMEEHGVSAKVVAQLGTNPSAVDGYTFHMIEQPILGAGGAPKMQTRVNPRTGKKEETQFPQTSLVVESIVASPDGKKSGGKSTATSAISGKGKATKVVEPEPEPEADSDDSGDDPVEQAAIELVQTVLASPKKFVPTFNAKEHNGGVTTSQMGTAALGNAIPKDTLKTVKKADVQKLVRSADFGEKFNGELWNFETDDDTNVNVYSVID